MLPVAVPLFGAFLGIQPSMYLSYSGSFLSLDNMSFCLSAPLLSPLFTLSLYQIWKLQTLAFFAHTSPSSISLHICSNVIKTGTLSPTTLWRILGVSLLQRLASETTRIVKDPTSSMKHTHFQILNHNSRAS